jgi:putative nucleotidyltransferase with HDIG domain
MNSRTRVYIGLVAAMAASLYAWLPLDAVMELPLRELVGAASFAGVALLAESLAIDFGRGRQARSSLSFIPLLACAMVFPPVVAISITIVVIAFSNFGLRKQDTIKAVFNVAQVAIAIGVGGLFYHFTSRFSPDRVDYAAFVVLAGTFFTANILLTGGALALMRGESLFRVLPQVLGPRGSNLWYDFLASPIAAVAGSLYQDYWIGGILIIVLPLLLIRYSYLDRLRLEEANHDLLRVFVKAIETRDPYTSGHSLRVSTLAREVAKDLNLLPRRVRRIETAALLHDIGKIDAIFADLIRKPYDLDPEERLLIRMHPVRGAELLETLSSVHTEVVATVRHHHERFDGSGYPAGLAGDAIPLGARIIMVCDSVDAMLSDRPYRNALSVAQAEAELKRCSGTQFDPAIVDVMLNSRTLGRAARLVAEEAVPVMELKFAGVAE